MIVHKQDTLEQNTFHQKQFTWVLNSVSEGVGEEVPHREGKAASPVIGPATRCLFSLRGLER